MYFALSRLCDDNRSCCFAVLFVVIRFRLGLYNKFGLAALEGVKLVRKLYSKAQALKEEISSKQMSVSTF